MSAEVQKIMGVLRDEIEFPPYTPEIVAERVREELESRLGKIVDMGTPPQIIISENGEEVNIRVFLTGKSSTQVPTLVVRTSLSDGRRVVGRLVALNNSFNLRSDGLVNRVSVIVFRAGSYSICQGGGLAREVDGDVFEVPNKTERQRLERERVVFSFQT